MKRELKAKEIIKKTCEYYDVNEKLMFKKLRSKEVVWARHIAMYIIKNELKLTHTDMGVLFKKERTTVIHGIEKIKDLLTLPHEVDLKKDIENIKFMTEMN